MTGVRIGILASLLLCIWLAWPKGDGTPPRPLMIKSALKDVNDPIVILGDSIVQRATLPRMLCKRTVINAGIDGSATASGLDGILKKALGDKKAALIVVSLGMNDADDAVSADAYRTNYTSLLAKLKAMSPRLAIASVTGLEVGKPGVGRRAQRTIDAYNTALSGIAQETGALLIPVPAMPADFTTDGIHLSTSGYGVWDTAMRKGVEAALCPNG